MTEREYFASEWSPGEPIDLWRKQDAGLAWFSREDLGWHVVAADDLERHLDGRELGPVDQETAERFVRRCRGVHDAPGMEDGPVGSRFVVGETVDLAARAGLLVSGHVHFGVIHPGDTLYSATTADPVPVLAVEFPTPREQASGGLTLLIDRRHADLLGPGRVLRAPQGTP